MFPVQPQPEGRNARMVTFSASPGMAPSMKTGPVTGLTRDSSSLSRSAAVEAGDSCPEEASSVSNSTVSPGAILRHGAKALFQPWWMCSLWIVWREPSSLMTTPRPLGTSADPPRGCEPAWERPGAQPARRLTKGFSWSCLLHRNGECAVDHEVGAGNAAGRRARDEHDAVGDFLGSPEPAGGVGLEGRGIEIGHV